MTNIDDISKLINSKPKDQKANSGFVSSTVASSLENSNQFHIDNTSYIGTDPDFDIQYNSRNIFDKSLVYAVNITDYQIHQMKLAESGIAAEYYLSEFANLVGVASAMVVAKENERTIRDIKFEIRNEFAGLNFEKFLKFIKNKKKYSSIRENLINKQDIAAPDQEKCKEAIMEYCKNKQLSDIGWKTFYGGFSGTTTAAGAIYITGSIIPGAKLITAIIAVVGTGVGLAGTAIGVAYNRYVLSKKIDEIYQANNENLVKSIENSVKDIQEKAKEYTFDLKGKLVKKIEDSVDNANVAYRFFRLERFSAAFTTMPSMIANVSSIFGTVLIALSGLLDIRKAKLQREGDMKDPVAFFYKFSSAKLLSPKYIIFGRSKFDEFLIAKCQENKFKQDWFIKGEAPKILNKNAKAKDIVAFKASLKTDKYLEVLQESFCEYIKCEYKNYLNAAKEKEDNQQSRKEFIEDSIAREFAKKTFYSDLFSSFKISGALALSSAISYSFHPALVIAELTGAIGVAFAFFHSARNKQYAKNHSEKFISKEHVKQLGQILSPTITKDSAPIESKKNNVSRGYNKKKLDEAFPSFEDANFKNNKAPNITQRKKFAAELDNKKKQTDPPGVTHP